MSSHRYVSLLIFSSLAIFHHSFISSPSLSFNLFVSYLNFSIFIQFASGFSEYAEHDLGGPSTDFEQCSRWLIGLGGRDTELSRTYQGGPLRVWLSLVILTFKLKCISLFTFQLNVPVLCKSFDDSVIYLLSFTSMLRMSNNY